MDRKNLPEKHVVVAFGLQNVSAYFQNSGNVNDALAAVIEIMADLLRVVCVAPGPVKDVL